jgi:hypothetical protein
MNLADQVLAVNDDLPIRTDKPVHSGKVRSVYWLTEADSRRLIQQKGYNVQPDAPLAIMIISDRISARRIEEKPKITTITNDPVNQRYSKRYSKCT